MRVRFVGTGGEAATAEAAGGGFRYTGDADLAASVLRTYAGLAVALGADPDDVTPEAVLKLAAERMQARTGLWVETGG